MQYVSIICAIFTLTVSLLFAMELATGKWEYSTGAEVKMISTFAAMFVFMLMTAGFVAAICECSTKLRKL